MQRDRGGWVYSPLEGVKVLDLTSVLSGPLCSYQLAQMGAEVIKVEHPRGDLARRLGADPELSEAQMGLSYLAINAGKESIVVNMKDPRGQEIILRLSERAEVVIENFRPGVMERLGLGYHVLRARNPGLIYCAISGFGQDGPWATRPAYDQIIQGLAGVMSITGDESSGPTRVGYSMSDAIGGLTAAMAIAGALVKSRSSGVGTYIDVSLLESTLATMGWAVADYLNTGIEPVAIGNENPTAAPSGTFVTQDGCLNIVANEQVQFETLCDLLNVPELKFDPRFALREARRANRRVLKDTLENRTRHLTTTYLEDLLNQNNVPAGRVSTTSQTLASNHLQERHFVKELPLELGADGRFKLGRTGFRFGTSDTEGPGAMIPPPKLGADTLKWLRRVGLSKDEIDHLVEEGVVGISRNSS